MGSGLSTSDNERFLRYIWEVDKDTIASKKTDKLKWYLFHKGGEYRKWYGNLEYVVNWKDNGKEIKHWVVNNPKDQKTTHWSRRIFNTNLYFRKGLIWSVISSGKISFRYTDENAMISNAAGGIFTINDSKNLQFLLVAINTNLWSELFSTINPTINYSSGIVQNAPLPKNKNETESKAVNKISQNNIDISKEEWDSRETSWDFRTNELIRMKNEALRVKSCRVEDAYNAYCDYWREKFYRLHANEEELNRLFIDIYELQDELAPDVPLEDITILKNEAKIVDGELLFQPEEIMKQLVSYGVGVMFGRYSLDHEGLHIANMNESLEDANLKYSIQNPTFEADDDNIIPVVDEPDYFADDIAERFEAFVAAAFGREYLHENIAFIEKALGKKLRNYFVKEFYKDHVKRYKKRPIYWMFASPKGMFQVLIYMHRYTPDTLNQILNDYLRPFRIRLESMRNDLMRISESEDTPTTERNLAEKKIEKIERTLDDINAYEKVLAHYAAKRIAIDLDDGVKVNYCKFKELVVPFDKKMCK